MKSKFVVESMYSPNELIEKLNSVNDFAEKFGVVKGSFSIVGEQYKEWNTVMDLLWDSYLERIYGKK